MEKIEKTFRDAFGKPYEEDILPREEVERILDDLCQSEVVRAGIVEHIDGYGKTYVYLDLTDGDIFAACHSCGSGYIREAHLVDIFSVDQYSIRDVDDECDYDDYVKVLYEEAYPAYAAAIADECTHEEACERAGIDWQKEKETMFLEDCCNNWQFCYDEENVRWQLDEIYMEDEE